MIRSRALEPADIVAFLHTTVDDPGQEKQRRGVVIRVCTAVEAAQLTALREGVGRPGDLPVLVIFGTTVGTHAPPKEEVVFPSRLASALDLLATTYFYPANVRLVMPAVARRIEGRRAPPQLFLKLRALAEQGLVQLAERLART